MVEMTADVGTCDMTVNTTGSRTLDPEVNGGWNDAPAGAGTAEETDAIDAPDATDGKGPSVSDSPHGPSSGGPSGGDGGRDGGGRSLWRDRLRRPGADAEKVDLRNTWQVVAGSILVPLGVVFILMSWYGAAHTRYVQQQIPYLVSGSFAGLGCMVLGGLLYWAHWLYRIYDQADHHHEEQLQAMQMTLRAISDRAGAAPFGDSGERAPAQGHLAQTALRPGRSTQDPGPTAETIYVVTPGGTVYHDRSCPIAARHPDGLRVLQGEETTGLAPCGICLG